MGLNLLSKEQVNAKDLMNTDLGHDSLENLDRISHGSVIVKPKSISVKGKKDFARSRALHTNSSPDWPHKGNQKHQLRVDAKHLHDTSRQKWRVQVWK